MNSTATLLQIIESAKAVSVIIGQAAAVMDGEELEDFVRRQLALQFQLNAVVTGGYQPKVSFEDQATFILEQIKTQKEQRHSNKANG